MESFLTALVIITISVLATWFKKKAQGDRDRNDERLGGSQRSAPLNRPVGQRPVASRPQSAATSWEEQLRRLLEGDTTTSQSPPLAPMRPPVVVTQTTQPAVIPLPVRVRPVVAPSASVPQAKGLPAFEPPMRQLANLEESRRAYERASQLDKTVAQHIDRVPGVPVKLTAVRHNELSPEVAQVVSLFKNPKMARRAVIASIILAPPKGLEESGNPSAF